MNLYLQMRALAQLRGESPSQIKKSGVSLIDPKKTNISVSIVLVWYLTFFSVSQWVVWGFFLR